LVMGICANCIVNLVLGFDRVAVPRAVRRWPMEKDVGKTMRRGMMNVIEGAKEAAVGQSTW